MHKKTLKIAIATTIGIAALATAGSGIAYQTKWSTFKKDFALKIKEVNSLFPGLDESHKFKLTSTSGHTVVYSISTTSILGKMSGTISEHYGAFAKFDFKKITPSGNVVL